MPDVVNRWHAGGSRESVDRTSEVLPTSTVARAPALGDQRVKQLLRSGAEAEEFAEAIFRRTHDVTRPVVERFGLAMRAAASVGVGA